MCFILKIDLALYAVRVVRSVFHRLDADSVKVRLGAYSPQSHSTPDGVTSIVQNGREIKGLHLGHLLLSSQKTKKNIQVHRVI